MPERTPVEQGKQRNKRTDELITELVGKYAHLMHLQGEQVPSQAIPLDALHPNDQKEVRAYLGRLIEQACDSPKGRRIHAQTKEVLLTYYCIKDDSLPTSFEKMRPAFNNVVRSLLQQIRDTGINNALLPYLQTSQGASLWNTILSFVGKVE